MAGFYGLSNVSSLFGSMGRTSAMSSIYSNLGEYASVKSGAYARATKAYYAKVAKPEKKTSDSETTKKTTNKKDQYVTSKTDKSSVALSMVKTEASELVDSAKKLTSTGKDSMFSDKDKYDKDAIYSAVNNFVTNYNDTVKALGNTTNSSVKNAAGTITRMTNVMKKSLSQIGITASDDGKLSVNEDDFKNADMNKVKSLFNGSGSYAGIVSSSASRVASEATNQLSGFGGSSYGSSGNYYNSFVSGLSYNGFF